MALSLYDASLRLGTEITKQSNAGALGRALPFFLGWRLSMTLLAAVAGQGTYPSDEARKADVARLGRKLDAAGWRDVAVLAWVLGRQVRGVAPAQAVAA